MTPLALILITVGSILIAYQDISKRLIHIASLAVFFLGTVLYTFTVQELGFVFSLLNLMFLTLLIFLLRIQIIIKKGYKERFINRYIGLGDIIILIIICFSYNLTNYIILLLASCLSGIVWSLTYKLLFKKKSIRIPLGGILSLIHLFIIFYSYINKINLINTPLLLEPIYAAT